MQGIFDHLISGAIHEIANENKMNSRKPYIALSLSGMPLKGLYDTGADVSCVAEKTFRRIPIDKRPAVQTIDRIYKFKGAGGQNLEVRGKFSLPLTLGQKSVSHEFFVIKDLGEDIILGIDFMHKHRLNYDTHTKSFSWRREGAWERGIFKVSEARTLPPLSLSFVKAKLLPENGATPLAGTVCVISVASPSHPLLTAGPVLVKTDEFGNIQVPIHNCSPVETDLARNDILGGAKKCRFF